MGYETMDSLVVPGTLWVHSQKTGSGANNRSVQRRSRSVAKLIRRFESVMDQCNLHMTGHELAHYPL